MRSSIDYIRNDNRILSIILSVPISTIYASIGSSLSGAPFISIFLIGILSFYIFLRNLDLLKSTTSRAVYILLGSVKFAAVIFNATTKAIPFTGVDWGTYDAMARSAIETSDSIVTLFGNSFDLYVFCVAIVYKIFGNNIEQIFFYMLPLSLITFRYVYKATALITKSTKKASIAGLLMLAWPVSFVFSISVLREASIQMLIAASFYYFILYIQGAGRLYKGIAFASAAALMHSGLVVVPLVYLYVAIQRIRRKQARVLKISALVIIGLVISLLVFSPFGSNFGGQLAKIDSTESLVESLAVRNEALSDATTSYISGAPANLVELLVSTPFRLAMFSMSPLPWQLRGLDTLLALIIDGMPQILLLIIIVSIVKARKKFNIVNKNIVITGIMIILASYIVFAIGTNNYGTAMRHRAKVSPIILVLAVSYYRYREVEKNR